MYALSCRTAAPGKLGLTDRGATVPSIQKLYVYCAQKVEHGSDIFKLI